MPWEGLDPVGFDPAAAIVTCATAPRNVEKLFDSVKALEVHGDAHRLMDHRWMMDGKIAPYVI